MDPQQHFAVALQSPSCVAERDREGWIALFDPHGFVEDPVEAGRYQGRDRIATFWDVFIAPQPSVRFEVHRDFWDGDTLIRQATVVNVTEADAHAELRVPAMLRYTVRAGRITALQAVWEPARIIAWFVRRGPSGLRALAKHSVRMLGKAGLGAGLSFGGTALGGLGRARASALIEAQYAGLVVDQLLVCGNHVGAFLRKREGSRMLSVMLRADGHGRVQDSTAIWSDAPAVLGEPAAERPSA